MPRPFFLCLLLASSLALLLAPAPSAAEEEPPFLRLVERSDFSRRVDGSYLGHAYREARLALHSKPEGGYAGEYFLLEETLRDLRSEARQLERSGKASFSLGSAGALEGGLELAFPALRGLPAAPPSTLEPGLSWIAPGTYLVELGEELFAFPFLAEYRAVGPTETLGRAVYLLKAKFALRARGRGSLLEASGSHELDIFLDARSGFPYLIRDRFEESFAFASGGKESRNGFRLLFYEGSPPSDRLALASALGEALGGGASEDLLSSGPDPLLSSEDALPLAESAELRAAGLELESAEAGLLLRILDLRFLPDSAELLPEEAGRLDLLARALLAAEGRSFLVEGHSAGVGRPEGELALSLLRARSIVEALGARGIAASRFVYRGLGSSRPLAPNSSEEGRARNRRVEITILD